MSDIDQWWLAGKSVKGTSHVRSGKLCEDAHCILERDGSFALVAADGASTRPKGGLGAKAVSRVVAKLLLSNADEVFRRKLHPKVVIDVALSAIDHLLEVEGGASRDDFACTLVGVLVRGNEAVTCHVGDGAVFCLEGTHSRAISPPERDPGGGSGTYFVTSQGVLPRMWSYEVPPYWTGFLCVSDGAQPALLNSTTGACSGLVGRALNQFDLADSRKDREGLLTEFIDSELRPRSDDDITVVGARRAFSAGVFGCPECRMPAVQVKWNKARTRCLGVCKSCGHQAFLHEEMAMEAAEALGVGR